MKDYPRTGASVIAVRDEKILLVKRGKDPFKGYWSLPGGSQEPGETLEDCARREFKEETSLEAGSLLFVTVLDKIHHKNDGALSHHYVLATYITENSAGEAKALDDADDVGWFTLDNMDALETTPDTQQIISQAMNDLF